jgi:GT2 family glycosyltransferase
MPVYNTPETLLRAAIDSVFGQVYDNWQLCIADDCSVAPHVRKVLNNYAARDKRVKVIFRQENGHISRATNTAFSLAEGDWIALLDHDDLLRPHSLAEVAMEINRHPEAEIIYSDEDKLDQRNNRYDPYFKPDFSRELFRSQNYLNHLTVHRAQNISAVGGWRTGFEGSQDYDLSLRIFERIDAKNIRHIPKVLYHWRAVEGSTASSGAEKTYAYEAGFRALQEHVARTKLAANVEDVPNTPFYRLRFSIPKNRPLVSLIIPTRDEVQLLQGCIRSILEKTTYPKYEILIINNRSTRNDTYTYFSELKKLPNVRVIPYDKPFNYSAMNNFAVSEAQGPIVGLINNDIAVISPDWLTEMVSWAAQDDIGCVGAKLYYANDTIQHAGVILGIGGVANHAHLGLRRGSPGYFGRAIVPGNFSAVTAACMIVRKFVYDQVGGLDAVNLPVAFNDVDFSLRVHQAGYQNVWTPYAELYHFESMSRGKDDTEEKRARFLREVNYMMHRWRDELALDPNYSPNFTNMRGDFSIGT